MKANTAHVQHNL